MRKKSLSPWFEVDTNPTVVQRILPQSKLERFEGIDLSPSGDVLAIATSETNAVLLFRRRADGRFEDGPYQTIDGSEYPHDVSFSNWKNGELLAVAQRAGAIAIYSKNGSNGEYTSSPMFEISGPHSRLAFSDGVVFVPPHDRYLAACNLELGTITFFRITSLSPLEIQNQPEHEWKHESIYHPDGLAFSNCGKWLAVANHGKQTVAIFQRRDGYLAGKKISFYPEPVTIIKDPRLRYPHSVAFTPTTNHVIVTNAGANYFCAYAPKRRWFWTQWSQVPESQVVVHDDNSFQEVNMANKMEGAQKELLLTKTLWQFAAHRLASKFIRFMSDRDRSMTYCGVADMGPSGAAARASPK